MSLVFCFCMYCQICCEAEFDAAVSADASLLCFFSGVAISYLVKKIQFYFEYAGVVVKQTAILSLFFLLLVIVKL